MKTFLMKTFLNFWPPFLGTGIWVKEISPDYHYIKVEMKMRFWNKNIVGTHFGGSLYAMADPFYMLMLLKTLGKNYIVWDKSAKINFVRPGKGNVFAEFILDKTQIEKIKDITNKQKKYEPCYTVLIKDTLGKTVAKVEKELYIRKK
jgi:acyl-coenzyme A thioesterase PaaI-like protein